MLEFDNVEITKLSLSSRSPLVTITSITSYQQAFFLLFSYDTVTIEFVQPWLNICKKVQVLISLRWIVAAPEKVARENVGVAADIWGVGVLAFILYAPLDFTFI